MFFCMERGHSVRFYNIRKYFVPKGVMRWIPKNSEVPHDKVNAKGPTGTKSCCLNFSFVGKLDGKHGDVVPRQWLFQTHEWR